MKALAALAALVACSRPHDVRVLLGPADGTLTIGFRCLADGTDELLFMRVAATQHFALVVDLITFDTGNPGCRGEELSQACTGGTCRLEPDRYCVDVDVSDLIDPDDPAMLRPLAEYLRQTAPIITPDAPDDITIIRAVATTEYCSTILAGPRLDVDQVVGCAYSCPTRLDEVESSITLSIDALTDRCEQLVRGCASYPPP